MKNNKNHDVGLRAVMRYVPRDPDNPVKRAARRYDGDFAEYVQKTTGEPLTSWHAAAIAQHLSGVHPMSFCLGPAQLRAMRRAAQFDCRLTEVAVQAQLSCRALLPPLEWLKRVRAIVVERAKRSPRSAWECLWDFVDEEERAWAEIYRKAYGGQP